MPKHIQSSFSRGFISPELHGRTDIKQYAYGLKQARNAIIHQNGSISNRPGTRFVGPVKDHTAPPILIPFQFKTTDTHIIELGNEYIRIIRNDGHITESSKSVTNITNADPGVVTVATHDFSNGDEIYLIGIKNMPEINDQRWLVANVSGTTFSLQDQVTGEDIDTTDFGAYTVGGAVSRILTVSTPYQQDELDQIKYVQTADIVTLVHPNYPPKELRRNSLTDWTLSDIVFRPVMDYPETLATSGGTGGADNYWQVTAIGENEEESLAGLVTASAATITAITQALPAVVTTSAAHGFADGDIVQIDAVVGMTDVNNRRFTINVTAATTFELNGEDSSGYTAYSSAGTATPTAVFNTNSVDVTITWAAIVDAIRYRVFKKSNGVFGFIGSTEATTFVDDDTVTPDTADTPPRLFEPFLGEDNMPAAVGFHQQRMIFGGSNNEPDTTYFSVVGDFNNFTHSIPIQADDSFNVTMASGKIDDIRHYISASKDLLVLTSGDEWVIQGLSSDSRLSIDTIQLTPQTSWGASHVTPIVIDSTVIFVNAAGHHIFTTSFQFENDHYVAKELTIYAHDLFSDGDVLSASYAKDPDPLIYFVKDDGKIGLLTYNEHEEVTGWAEWDTDGKFEHSACIQPSIDEPHRQAYVVVKRKINGNTVRYIERTVDRHFDSVADCIFLDSSLTLDDPKDISNISLSNPVAITAPGHGLADDDLVDIVDVEWEPDVDEFGNETQPDQLNNTRFIVSNATSNTFTLQDQNTEADIDGTAFNAWLEGGVVRKAVNSLSGAFHLKNTDVYILADGNVIKNLSVDADGDVTLPQYFSRVHLGLPYTTDIETLDPEFTITGFKTVQGMRKKVNYVILKLTDTRGMWVGPDNTHLVEMKQREFEDMSDPTALFTGTKDVGIKGDWNLSGNLFIRQRDPLPITINAIVSDIDVGEDH